MTDFSQNIDLQSLLAVIASSPIIVSLAEPRDFADWCVLQAPADIDTVILDWLRSQAPQAAALS